MRSIEMIPSEKTFAEWVECENRGLELTTEEASVLLEYITMHNCHVCVDATGAIVLVDVDDPESSIIAIGFYELLERVVGWNYALLQDAAVTGLQREQVLKHSEVLENIMDGMGYHGGLPLGIPTVKELIAVLSKMPEDFRVTCCGANCNIHLFPKSKVITIDCEQYLT